MSRICMLLVAAAVAAGVVGCAQCDTCDDFPAPCTGPNCRQNGGGILDYMSPTMAQGAPTMGSPAPNTAPVNDAAGPAPMSPPTPAVDPTSPAPAMEAAPKPN